MLQWQNIFFPFTHQQTIVAALALREGALAAAICLTNPSWSLTPVLHIQKTEGVGEDNLSSRDQENKWEEDRARDKQPFTYFWEVKADIWGSLNLSQGTEIPMCRAETRG